MSEEQKKEKAAPAAEKPAPKPHVVKEAHAHGKKVTKMNLAEVNEAIVLCQKQQGGLWSHYGKSLVGHKAALTAHQAPVYLKKAA